MTVHAPTRIRWRVLALVILASLGAYFLRANVSTLGETMIKDLGLTEIHLGYIFSAFAAGYAIFQLPGGVMGNRFGARRMITGMLLAWAGLTILTALVPGADTLGVVAIVASLVVIRFLVGATQAPIFPVTCGGTIANWFPVGGWGLPFGLQIAGYTLGAAAAAPLLVWLMEGFGWRGALLITGPPAALAAGLWWWYVRDFPGDHSSVNSAEIALIDANRSPPCDKVVPGAWKRALANRDILLLTISYFCVQYVFYLFFSWFFFYLVEVREFDNRQAGLFVSAQWVVGAIAGLGGGILTDLATRRLGIRRGPRDLAIISLVLCAVTLYVGAVSSNVTLVVSMLCLSFGFTQVADNPYWIAAMAVAERQAEVATGVLNTGGNVVGFVGGMLVPLIALGYSWTAAMASGAVFALVAALLWCFVRADRPMMEMEQGA
jgi:ACS family glucarate transporter-like MFS transporter